MFPTTIWTAIHRAGDADDEALASFASEYREPILATIRAKGFAGHDAEDLCQQVFLRVLAGDVLGRADPRRGRFRSLLRTVTARVVVDHLRKRRVETVQDLEPACTVELPDFDRAWAVHLTERALAALQASGSPYFGVIEAHLAGARVDRNKLWIARRKLAERIRREVALTCERPEDVEAELADLAPWLRGRTR